jgi:quercetin dioxygenase-like cupin family protein
MTTDTTVADLFSSGRLVVDEKHRIDLDERRVLSLTVVQLAAGVVEPAHTHPGFEILYGLSGRGHVTLDHVVTPLSAGQVVHVAEGTVKALANDGHEPMAVLAVLVLDRDSTPFVPVGAPVAATGP